MPLEAYIPTKFKVSDKLWFIPQAGWTWQVVEEHERWVPGAFFIMKQDAEAFAHYKNEMEEFKAKMRRQHIEEEAERNPVKTSGVE